MVGQVPDDDCPVDPTHPNVPAYQVNNDNSAVSVTLFVVCSRVICIIFSPFILSVPCAVFSISLLPRLPKCSVVINLYVFHYFIFSVDTVSVLHYCF